MPFSVRIPSPTLLSSSISNLSPFVVSLALSGLRKVIRDDHHPWFIATQLGFVLVGIGSWLFHATLLYQVCLHL